MKYVSVQGIGRVGAPSRTRCRPHKFWVVVENYGPHYEGSEYPQVAWSIRKFRTGRAAAQYAYETYDYDLLTSYVLHLLDMR